MKPPLQSSQETSKIQQGEPTYDQADASPAAQRSRLRNERNDPRPGPHLKAETGATEQLGGPEAAEPGAEHDA